MKDLNYAALLTNVISIAKEAGQAILEIYDDQSRFDINTKSDDTPVTAADIAANAIIAKGLANLLPETPILSEEANIPDFETRKSWQQYWLVDPLDGTKEFIHGTDEFTVNIALIVANNPVLGVVYCPVKDLLYQACKDGGAYKTSKIDGHHAIHSKTISAPELTITISRRHKGHAMTLLEESIENYGLSINKHLQGSSLKLCAVAEGSADIYPRFGLTSEWDTAASQIIIEEAGGHLLDHGWKPLKYNTKDSLLNPEFMAFGDTPEKWRAIIKGHKPDSILKP